METQAQHHPSGLLHGSNPVPLGLRDHLWLLLTISLDPFRLAVRLPVIGYGATSLHCSCLKTPQGLMPWFHMLPRRPQGTPIPSTFSIRSIPTVSLLDDRWPDALNHSFQTQEWLFEPNTREKILEVTVAPTTQIPAMMERFLRDLDALRSDTTGLTPLLETAYTPPGNQSSSQF